MAVCKEAHEQFDGIANADARIGELPEWMHVRRRVLWWVFQGAYDDLGHAWRTFHEKGREAGARAIGPPGDVYVCDPDDHMDDPGNILTVLWMPVE